MMPCRARQAAFLRRTAQSTSGRKLSQRTGFPRMAVSRSMAGQWSDGTRPRARHMLGRFDGTPIARAKSAVESNRSMASSRACMRLVFRGYHDRDCNLHTTVTQVAPIFTLVSSIGDRVRDERARLGISQQTLARLAGVSTSTIGNLEAGIRSQPRALLSIAQALGVTPEWLENGQGPRATAATAPALTSIASSTEQCLQLISAALAAAPPDAREALAVNLAGWARDGGAAHWQAAVQGLLDSSAASRKRRSAA